MEARTKMLLLTVSLAAFAVFAIGATALVAQGGTRGSYAGMSNTIQHPQQCASSTVGGVSLGGLQNLLFLFTNGSKDANWQSASKGFAGDVLINGLVASERTSGSFAYAGTISTNDSTLGAWQQIVDNNAGQAVAVTGAGAAVSAATTALNNAFAQINALAVTPGFENRSATSLNGLNTQNGVPETIVVNVTSGFQVSSQINITGDATDAFILRWDTDANPANGYQGQVKFQSGGAIVPRGGLTPGNFISVAGDITASGGGSTPPPPYPQGPRLNNGTGALINGGSDFSGGGFFTGYWLTTGNPATGETSSMSNAIFVGGWYSTTTKFSMTSGTSGVHICPPPPPTAASMRDFTARPIARGALLRWTTGTESSLLGFNVWRFHNGSGVKVNRTLVLAKRSGEAGGASYTFLDRHPGARRGLSYRLQLVDLQGKRSWYTAFAIPA